MEDEKVDLVKGCIRKHLGVSLPEEKKPDGKRNGRIN